MGTIEKGTIASVNAAKNTARVQTKAGIVTNDLVIPWHLRGGSGNLTKGMEVVFTEFDDQTGILLGRADGNWGFFFTAGIQTAGGITAGGGITASGDVKAGKISLQNHTHNYNWTDDAGSSVTGTPNE